jgi:hypothetical protein
MTGFHFPSATHVDVDLMFSEVYASTCPSGHVNQIAVPYEVLVVLVTCVVDTGKHVTAAEDKLSLV